jgi:hypothetical protein
MGRPAVAGLGNVAENLKTWLCPTVLLNCRIPVGSPQCRGQLLLRSGTGLQGRSQGAVLDRFGVFESPADDRRRQGFGVATLFVLTEKGCAAEGEMRPGGRFNQIEEALIGTLEERLIGFSSQVTECRLGFRKGLGYCRGS